MEGRFAWYTLEFKSSAGDAMLWSRGCCEGITWQDEDQHRILCISGGGSLQSVRFSRWNHWPVDSTDLLSRGWNHKCCKILGIMQRGTEYHCQWQVYLGSHALQIGISGELLLCLTGCCSIFAPAGTCCNSQITTTRVSCSKRIRHIQVCAMVSVECHEGWGAPLSSCFDCVDMERRIWPSLLCRSLCWSRTLNP